MAMSQVVDPGAAWRAPEGHPGLPPIAPSPPPAPVLVRADDPFSRFMTRMWARSPKWSAPLAILVCFAGGLSYTLAVHPADAGAASSPTCLVKLTTGFDCPGCGGTRAFWFLAHGDIPAAARSHLLAVFAAPFLVYLYIAWSANLVFKRRLPMPQLSPKAISFYLAAWGVFAVLRNLPWAPFTWFYV
jgi:hypothetical protein